ncbi:uncharacterized protein VTP21DRAFT_11691 [Calcarisporiella thermophila]|uniref:uncharacterized protein n=1 Tax=Calcarisporiella thermophila TaxID=911321 RepID=UPI003742A4FA
METSQHRVSLALKELAHAQDELLGGSLHRTCLIVAIVHNRRSYSAMCGSRFCLALIAKPVVNKRFWPIAQTSVTTEAMSHIHQEEFNTSRLAAFSTFFSPLWLLPPRSCRR